MLAVSFFFPLNVANQATSIRKTFAEFRSHMKIPTLIKRFLFVTSILALIGTGYRLTLLQPKQLHTVAQATNQTVEFHFTNDGLKLGALPQPVKVTGIVIDNQRYALDTVVPGDLSTLDRASLVLTNVTDTSVRAIALRLTAFGLDRQPIAILPGLPVLKYLGQGQTQTVSLIEASRSLQSKAAQTARTITRVEATIEYIEFLNGNRWRYGLLHRPFAGFSRECWIVDGRESQVTQQLLEFQRQTGEELPSATAVQHFQLERQGGFNRSVQLAGVVGSTCMSYAGMAIVDCSLNGNFTGCETMMDYGGFSPPFNRFDVWDDLACFAWGPTSINCASLPPYVGTFLTSEMCQ